jgi:hypothetical protein
MNEPVEKPVSDDVSSSPSTESSTAIHWSSGNPTEAPEWEILDAIDKFHIPKIEYKKNNKQQLPEISKLLNSKRLAT